VIGALTFVLALASGWFMVRAVLGPGLRPGWAARAVEAALGCGAGIALSSVAYFLLLVVHAASPASVAGVNCVLFGCGVWLAVRARGCEAHAEQPASGGSPSFRWNWLLALALLAGFALVLSGLIGAAKASPYGEWDAWSIWNLRAKYLADPSGGWQSAVSPLLERSHPDYPLLLPGFIAMAWKSAGETPAWVPQAAGFLFLGLVIALLLGCLALHRSTSSALLAGFVLLASTSFLYLAPMQYADLPLAFYFLASIALIVPSSASGVPRGRRLALAGFFASCAAWTKNEGAVFALLMAACLLIFEARQNGIRKALASWRPFALGAAPVLVLVACFALWIAPASDPLLHQNAAQLMRKIEDFARYKQVGQALFSEAYHFGQPWSHPLLLLAILAVGLRFRRKGRYAPALAASGLVIALVFSVYLGVYIVTPRDLAWHLHTSLARLYAQLWPGVVLLFFMLLRTPEETGLPAVTPPLGAKRKIKTRQGNRTALRIQLQI